MFCKKKIKHQMTDEERDSFLRWQDYRINQLSFSINLFLGFAVASIGFLIGKKGQLYEGIGQKNPEMLLILFCWSVSAMFGVIAALSRLVDFRYSAKRIRGGRKDYGCLTKVAGHVTWVSFGCEVISYCIGAYLFIRNYFV